MSDAEIAEWNNINLGTNYQRIADQNDVDVEIRIGGFSWDMTKFNEYCLQSYEAENDNCRYFHYNYYYDGWAIGSYWMFPDPAQAYA